MFPYLNKFTLKKNVEKNLDKFTLKKYFQCEKKLLKQIHIKSFYETFLEQIHIKKNMFPV